MELRAPPLRMPLRIARSMSDTFEDAIFSHTARTDAFRPRGTLSFDPFGRPGFPFANGRVAPPLRDGTNTSACSFPRAFFFAGVLRFLTTAIRYSLQE